MQLDIVIMSYSLIQLKTDTNISSITSVWVRLFKWSGHVIMTVDLDTGYQSYVGLRDQGIADWSTSMSRTVLRSYYASSLMPLKNQFGHPKAPTRGFGTQCRYFAFSSLVLYGIRLLSQATLWSSWVSTNESAVMYDLDKWERTSLHH